MIQLNAIDRLARLIENCIFDSRQVAQNPRLVAIASFYGFVPFEEIWATFSILGVNFPSANDIEMMITACKMSYILSRYLIVNGSSGKSGVFLPFQISAKELVITSVPKKCSKEKLKLFITQICGTTDFKVEKSHLNNENKRSFIVTFCSLEHSLFLWRALRYVPIEGETYLEAEANIIKATKEISSNDNSKTNPNNTLQQQETKYNNQKKSSSIDNNDKKGKFFYRNNNISNNNNGSNNNYNSNKRNNNYTYIPENNHKNNANDRSNYTRRNNDVGERNEQIVVNITRRKEYLNAAPSLKISIERAPRLVIEKV